MCYSSGQVDVLLTSQWLTHRLFPLNKKQIFEMRTIFWKGNLYGPQSVFFIFLYQQGCFEYKVLKAKQRGLVKSNGMRYTLEVD